MEYQRIFYYIDNPFYTKNLAAFNCHIEVIKWLHENRKEHNP